MLIIDRSLYRNGILSFPTADQELSLVSSNPLQGIRMLGSVEGETFSTLAIAISNDDHFSSRDKQPITSDHRFFSTSKINEEANIATQINSLRGGSLWSQTIPIVPDYGYFHRLVYRAEHMLWDEDLCILGPNHQVHFISDRVGGPYLAGVGEEKSHQGSYGVDFDVHLGCMEGRFIEVITRGKSPEDAKLKSQALMGYVGLVMGDGVYKELVIEAALHAQVGKTTICTLSGRHQLGFDLLLDQGSVEERFSGLSRALGPEATDRATELLGRYALASSERNEELRFMALISGIDGFLNAYVNSKHKSRLKEQLPENIRHILETSSQFSESERSRLRSAFSSVHQSVKLQWFLNDHNADEGMVATLRDIWPVRNKLFHHGISRDVWSVIDAAEKIARSLIELDLNLDPKTFWKFRRAIGATIQLAHDGREWSI